VKEAEIRPAALLDEYLALSARDGERLDRSQFVFVPCPACEGSTIADTLEKHGYRYARCGDCGTLYCSPRPSPAQLDALYFTSESSHFWSNVFFPAVRDARREKLFKPQARRIADLVAERGLPVGAICDIGAGHGLFLEELRPHFPGSTLFAIEPDATSAAVCRTKGFEVIESTAERTTGWDARFELVISSEVLEHVFDPASFAASIGRLTRPGGHALVTGLAYEGFDILFLQERSKSVSPPHHLNFLSVDGARRVFGRAGFRDVDVWTPGVLDVDIALQSGVAHEFLRVLKGRGDEAARDLQAFLQRHNLSSHMWILARK
jgi:SAM-dependent methyltransferase